MRARNAFRRLREGTEREQAPPDHTFLDEVTAILWIPGKPEPGQSVTVRTFDLEKLELDLHTFVLERVAPTAVSGIRTVFFEGKVYSDRDWEMGTARLSATGSILSWMLGENAELRAEPVELAKKIGYSADLFVQSLVKIDKALRDPHRVERLVVEVDGQGERVLQDGPRQRVERTDGVTILRLGPCKPVAATPEEVEKCAAAAVDYPTEDPRVVALMKEAVGDATTPAMKVERLVRFVSDYVQDAIDADATSVLRIIQGKVGDCTEHALLFACLARTAGIPAREVTGIMYMGDEVRAFGSYAWNEVVLDGQWVPVNATWNETVIDAGHIRMGHGGRGDFATFRGMEESELRLREVNRSRAVKQRPAWDGSRSTPA